MVFLDPSSPRLAFGSPGPPNNYMVKKPSELQLPQSDPLPINRHPKGVLRGSKVQRSALEGIERREKEEEEERSF